MRSTFNRGKTWSDGDFMKLTQEPEVVTWPPIHYAYVEKIGPFQTNAPRAWQALHQLVPGIFGTQQNRGKHEPVPSRTQNISRGGSRSPRQRRTCPTASGIQSSVEVSTAVSF